MKKITIPLACAFIALVFSICVSYRTSAPYIGCDPEGVKAEVLAELDQNRLNDE